MGKSLFFSAFFILLCLLFVACGPNSSKKGSNLPPDKDSASQVSSAANVVESNEEQNALDTAAVNTFNQIAGTWNALDGDQDLTIIISKDSIFYTEHAELHKYELRNDSIFIHYPDYVLSGKPILLKDTFAIISEDQTSKFSRKIN
jgi:hypothetical protein